MGEGDASQSIRLLEKSERSIRYLPTNGHHDAGGGGGGTLEPPAASKNKLGTFLGVYIPTVLGIFGVVIFLRLSWITGQAGTFHSHSLSYIGSYIALGMINTYLMYLIAGSVAGLTGTCIHL